MCLTQDEHLCTGDKLHELLAFQKVMLKEIPQCVLTKANQTCVNHRTEIDVSRGITESHRQIRHFMQEHVTLAVFPNPGISSQGVVFN